MMVRKIKNIFKFLAFTIILTLSLITLYLVFAVSLSVFEINSSNKNSNKEVNIFILSNGIHADLAMPVKTKEIDWSKTIKFDFTFSKDSSHEYLAFGWGDRKFYLETPTWNDLRFDVAFQALFLCGESAIHTTFFQSLRETDDCIKVQLSSSDYRLLIEYIKNQFKRDESGNLIPISDLYYGLNDTFYEAKGTFTLFHTCNTWVNNALKTANQKSCLWTPFVQGILFHYR